MIIRSGNEERDGEEVERESFLNTITFATYYRSLCGKPSPQRGGLPFPVPHHGMMAAARHAWPRVMSAQQQGAVFFFPA